MRFKQLVWNKVLGDTNDLFTVTAALEYFYINFEEGLWWASWDGSLPGTTDLESLKLAAQKHHEEYLMKFVEDEPITQENVEKKFREFSDNLSSFKAEIQQVLENQDARIAALNLGEIK